MPAPERAAVAEYVRERHQLFGPEFVPGRLRPEVEARALLDAGAGGMSKDDAFAPSVALVLALSEGSLTGNSPVRATLVRSAYLQPGRASVWTYGPASGVRVCPPLTRAEAQAAVREEAPALRGPPALRQRPRRGRRRSPDPRHRRDGRPVAHPHAAQRHAHVDLPGSARAVGRGVEGRAVVRTGVHSTDRRESRTGRHAIRAGALSDDFARAILDEVREACAGPAVAKESAQRAEHWLQRALPPLLRRVMPLAGRELGQSVLREVPTRRPAGGTGFIDLVALDDDGVLRIIETKLGSDPMLVLQGLDYLIWVEANLATSVCSHVASSRLTNPPTSYRGELEAAAGLGLIDGELASSLQQAVGMRNLLVHEYARADLQLVAAAVPRARTDAAAFVRQVSSWLLREG